MCVMNVCDERNVMRVCGECMNVMIGMCVMNVSVHDECGV